MTKNLNIVMPAFRTADSIFEVVKKIDFRQINKLIVVDDCCPLNTGKYLKNQIEENFELQDKLNKKKIIFINNKINMGVGGATKKGFEHSIEQGADFVIKIDSDGQMNPLDIQVLIKKQSENDYDYVKGNRLIVSKNYKIIPFARLIGNLILSMISKINSGYRSISDPINGFFLIKTSTLNDINYKNLNNGFFFESDIINRLGNINAKISEIPQNAVYANNKSNLKIYKVILPFIILHMKFFLKKFL